MTEQFHNAAREKYANILRNTHGNYSWKSLKTKSLIVLAVKQLLKATYVCQSVERWSRDPEVAGSIPSRRSWSCIFRNLVPVES